eukprot:EG_transcript_4712
MRLSGVLALALSVLLSAITVGGKEDTALEVLTGTTFADAVFNSESVWTVLFYTPKDKGIKQLQSTFESHATKMKGVVRSGMVDTSQADAKFLLDVFAVKATPEILALPSAVLVKPEDYKPVPYKGTKTANAISSWAAKQLPADLVAVLQTEAELAAFLDGRPGVPKAALFSEKGETSPLFRALSLRLAFRMALGEVRAKANPFLAEKYAVTTFPTLMVFEGGSPRVYTGANDIESIFAWLEPQALSRDQREEMKRRHEEAEQHKARQQLVRAANPTQRVTSPREWAELVTARGSISLVAFLDPLDPKHKEYLRALKRVHRNTRAGGTQYNFVWLDATQQAALAAALDAGGEAPRLVFLNSRKGWYKAFVGPFTTEAIWTYAGQSLLKGAGRPVNVAVLPPVVAEQNEDLAELDPDEEPEGKAAQQAAAAKAKGKKSEGASAPKKSTKGSPQKDSPAEDKGPAQETPGAAKPRGAPDRSQAKPKKAAPETTTSPEKESATFKQTLREAKVALEKAEQKQRLAIPLGFL